MKPDDRIYGSRSGVQKAIRRGDLNLAKTTFDFLWSASVNRNWLKWRMVSIVQEEVLPMLGELPSLYKEGMNESAWRKFVYRLTLSPKNKDAEALRWLATYTPMADGEHEELSLMREWLAPALSNPSEASSRLLDLRGSGRWETSKYVDSVLEVLDKRASQGGILEDRVNSIAAMVLLRTRELKEEEVSLGVGMGLQWFSDKIGGNKFSPKKVPLPWYCFDMHTQVGKIVLGSLAKKMEMRREEFSRLWFFCESARTLKDAVEWRCVTNGPRSSGPIGIWDTVWWNRNLSEALRIGSWTPQEAIKEWGQIREKVRDMVEWLLKKRGEER